MNLKPDHKDRIFAGIIVAAHILFFLLAVGYKRIYMGDSFEYIYEALNIKQYLFFYSGNPAMPIAPEYMTQRQPGYPLFLLAIYLLTVNNWIVLLFQNLISVCNIYYTRTLLLRLGFQKKYDWLLLLFVIAYPAQFINANTIAPDILLQTFTLLYFGNFIRLFKARQLRYAGYMSLALVGGMLVKPVLYPFVAVHLVIIIAVAVYQRAKLQRPVLVALFPLCAVLLYNYWNYTRTGKFHFSSNQAFNAVYYYYPFVSRQAGIDSAQRFLQQQRHDIALLPEYRDRYDYANEQGTQLLKNNFAPYMAFHLANSARIFIEPGKAEIDLFTGKLTYGHLYSKEQTGFWATVKNNGVAGMRDYISRNPSLLLALAILIVNCIRTAGILLFLKNKNVPAGIRLSALVLLWYFAVAAGPIANTRYFLPVSLIAIACATLGYMNLLQSRRQKT